MPYAPSTLLHHGRYQLVSRLHETTQSVVWRAIDSTLNQECAIKTHRFGNPQGTPVARALNEAKITGALDHPHLTAVYDTFQEEHAIFLVMPLAAGSLADWLALRGALPIDLAVVQFLGVLDALQRVHDLGVIHRDIKPSNLLITSEGRLQLADFGIAHLVNQKEALTTTGAVMGSLAYMSPEQRGGYLPPTHQSDLYSLAIALTESLIGEAMVDLFADRQQNRLRKLLPEPLVDVLLVAGAYEPAERMESAATMADAIRAVHNPAEQFFSAKDFTGLPLDQPRQPIPELPPTPPPIRAAPPTRRIQPWTLLGIALLSLAAGLGFIRWSSSTETTPPVQPDDPWVSVSACPDALVSLQGQHVLGPRESLGATAQDIDGDGQQDLVFTNQLEETLTIYWGNPAGSMDDITSLPTLRSESRVAIGDVDGDGQHDLLVASPDDASFALHRGTGNRSFEPAHTFFQGSRPSFPWLIDWDADGALDLLFTHLDCIAWRKGQGEGSFGPHACLGRSTIIKGVLDRDQDGLLELLVPTKGGLETWERDTGGWVGERRRLASLPPGRVHVSAADIDGKEGAEIYLLRPYTSPSVIRMTPPEWNPCALAQTRLPFELHAMTALDANSDGAVDFVGTRTCAGCTSNHLLYRGELSGGE